MTILEQLPLQNNSDCALISSHGIMKYADVVEKIYLYADFLQGLRPKCIALYLDNCFEWVITDLAAHLSNIPVVPLPTFFSQAQLIHLIDDVNADLLITNKQLSKQPLLSLFQKEPIKREPTGVELYQRTISSTVKYPAGLSKITYTSGSTGSPKGVCLSAKAQLEVVSSLRTILQPLNIKKHLCVLPLSTLLENIAGVWAPLSTGALVAVPSLRKLGFEGASQLRPQQFLNTIFQHDPESIILVPELLKVLVSAYEAGALRSLNLKFIAVGGAKVSSSLLKRAQSLGLPVYEGYGLSECCSVVSLNRPFQNKLGTSGQVLPHAKMRISDDNEIEVLGSNMLGYLHQESLMPDFYPTGDLGEIDDDGYIKINGRKKNMFITSYGRKVNPEWIEEVLLEHELIKQTIVFGENLSFNIAIIVPNTKDINKQSIAHAVAQSNLSLPNYARVSRYLIADSPFNFKSGTLTSNGKLKRDAIWKLYEKDIQLLTENAKGMSFTAAAM